MSLQYWFTGNIQIFFGQGSCINAGKIINQFGSKKPLVIADPNVVKTGSLTDLFTSLGKEGKNWNLFCEVKENAPTDCVDSAAEKARINQNDGIIAIGGGSTMDTAKTAALLAKHEGSIQNYLPGAENEFCSAGLPLVTVPTTSGTGSELSIYAVHTDSFTDEKFCFTGQYFTSKAVILDPCLTVTMPQKYTVSTAIDTLVHGIEAYTSKPAMQTAVPYIDCLSLEVIKLVKNNLPIVLDDPYNMDARLNLMYAAAMGGSVIGYGVGAAHGMDSALIHHFGMAHGEAVGQLIPYVMEYNSSKCTARMKTIADLMGVNTTGMNEQEAALEAALAVKKFCCETGLSCIRQYRNSVEKNEIKKIVSEVRESYSVVENLVPMKEKDIEDILGKALNGVS